MTANDDVLNAQAAAELLGAHVETIRRMARKGAIPAYKIGKDWRFRRAELLAWSQTRPAAATTATILVVDDDRGVRSLIERYLQPQGYQVLTAATGIEGMDRVQSAAIDLVLLDLEMPEMNGPAFVRELRRRRLEIPVIVVTGYPDSDLMLETSRCTPLMLIAKPIDKQMLLSAVAMTLSGRPLERRAV